MNTDEPPWCRLSRGGSALLRCDDKNILTQYN